MNTASAYQTIYPKKKAVQGLYTGFLSFVYIPLSAFWISPDEISFDALEKALSKCEKSAVVRIYINYPGCETGLPDFMRFDSELAYTDPKGRCSVEPDYNDPRILNPVLMLIQQFGRRYDLDPRIAFIQIGTFGQYGEWTTCTAGKDLRYSVETQRAVISAFCKAFHEIPLQGRHAGISYDPSSVSVGGEFDIGYHDDMVPLQWHSVMLPSLENAGRADAWKTKPIGGEVDSRIWNEVLSTYWQDMLTMAAESHLTYLAPAIPKVRIAKTTGKPNKTDLARLSKLESLLGHSIRVQKVRMPKHVRAGECFQIEVTFANDGNAPFYRKWPIMFTVGGRPIAFGSYAALLLPGKHVCQFMASCDTVGAIDALEVKIAGPNRQHLPLANEGALKEGWLKLGEVEVRA